MDVQICFHRRGERDAFRDFLSPFPPPQVGTILVFGQTTWRVSDVTYNFDTQRIEVIANKD